MFEEHESSFVGRVQELSEQKPVQVPWRNVIAFRLSRHHLSERGPASALTSVVADMGGAQAQVLSAAQISIWARVKQARIKDIDSALWKDHSLVKAWCMRRTLFLLPSNELAIFARGTTRRPAHHYRYAIKHVGSQQALDKLLDAVMEILKQPTTRGQIAKQLDKSYGYKIKSKTGGGWGSKTLVPWVEVGKSSLPVGQLFHIIGARDVICSGPSKGNESTYVRADQWITNWKDVSVEKAERELLVRYLSAFGPSTVTDFALWMGVYVRDARPIWERESKNIVPVDVEGWKAGILKSDLDELEDEEVEGTIVRLLPNFDSFLLGHKSHRNIVDERNHRKVYRSQGWVSPVLLVDGKAVGVWSMDKHGSDIGVHVTPFGKIPGRDVKLLREEVADLGRFLENPAIKTIIE